MDKLEKCAGKILKEVLRVKKGEKVCLVKDEDSSIVNAFEKALSGMKINYEVFKITINRASSSPIPKAKKTFANNDIIIAPTKNSITHSAETTEAQKKGKRIVTMPGITEEIFLKILDCSLNEIAKLNEKLYKQVKNSKCIKIITPSGTNLEIKLDPKRKWRGVKKINPRRGFVANMPAGEIFVAPLENGANGVIAIDSGRSITPKNRAKIEVKNGRIVSWNKGAKSYVDYLKRNDAKNGFTIAELGIGTNKAHKKPMGTVLHDEKIYGSCHVAFGRNISFGGRNKAKVHGDVILMNPTIIVDGKKLRY